MFQKSACSAVSPPSSTHDRPGLTAGSRVAELEGKARRLAPGAIKAHARGLLNVQPLAPAAVPAGKAARGRVRSGQG